MLRLLKLFEFQKVNSILNNCYQKGIYRLNLYDFRKNKAQNEKKELNKNRIINLLLYE